MNNEDFKNMAEAATVFITTYETGFKTIKKNHPDMDFSEIATLTEIWWRGFCDVIAGMGKGGTE